jgi:hypothetical protein
MMIRTTGALPQVKWPILEGKIYYLRFSLTMSSVLQYRRVTV